MEAESNYITHAKMEFRTLGYDLDEKEEGPNKWIMENVFALLNEFSKQGHSGSSAPFCIEYFRKLAAFEPLSPLKGDDSEWNDCGNSTWQNNRCSHVFKGKNGKAYDIDGYVFWHWNERPLDSYEDGFPGTHKYKSRFTGWGSRKLIEFPYSPKKPVEVEVECYETNKETGEREPGSGWWHTIYPDWLVKETEELKVILEA